MKEDTMAKLTTQAVKDYIKANVTQADVDAVNSFLKVERPYDACRLTLSQARFEKGEPTPLIRIAKSRLYDGRTARAFTTRLLRDEFFVDNAVCVVSDAADEEILEVRYGVVMKNDELVFAVQPFGGGEDDPGLICVTPRALFERQGVVDDTSVADYYVEQYGFERECESMYTHRQGIDAGVAMLREAGFVYSEKLAALLGEDE